MKKSTKILFAVAVGLLALFALFTVLVKTVDVAAVGPLGSSVGFSGLNKSVFDALGTSEFWYDLTELAGLVALASAGGFAAVGLYQLIKRKSLAKVDKGIWALAVFYAVVLACYVLFEIVVINERPVLIEGVLEASYPSSHTILVSSFLGGAIVAFHRLVGCKRARICFDAATGAIIAVTAVGRLLSGVHWLTDILAALLLSASLVTLYAAVEGWLVEKE